MSKPDRRTPHKGRGAASNPAGRFEPTASTADDDGWGILEEPLPRLLTEVRPERAKRIVTRNASPDIPFSQSINPYRGCEHGCVYCLRGDTPILYADGSHRPIKDASVGDAIIGTVRRGRYRSYVETRILNHWSTVKPGYRITLVGGTELVASGDHRFLTERGWKFVADAGSGRPRRPYLTPRNRLLGTGAFAEQPDKCAEYRRGYLRGMINGDGHVGARVCPARPGRIRDEHYGFRFAPVDAQVLRRVRRYLGTFQVQANELQFQAAVGQSRELRAMRPNRRVGVETPASLFAWPEKPSDAWCKGFLAGRFDADGRHDRPGGTIRLSNTDPSIIEVVTRALDRFGFPYWLERVDDGRQNPLTNVRLRGGLTEKLRFFHLTDPAIGRKWSITGIHLQSGADLRISAIEPLVGAERMYDITTGTGDFIANGVVSHNCYARPAHAFVNLSPGLDFETRLFYKAGATELLTKELSAKKYRCSPIALGSNTDPYQPIERRYRVTREILELLSACDHPATIVTKGAALIERDLELLANLARRRLVAVFISITTLDAKLKRALEPRAASPSARLAAIERLHDSGVPVGVMVAPVIPVLTDHELERILEVAAKAGAATAGYVMLRLPHEVAGLFREWLEVHEPLKAEHVMSRIRALRQGRENDPEFGSRQRGTGVYAELFRQRFEVASRRFGLDRDDPRFDLDCGRFRPPSPVSGQQSLF